MTLYLQLQEEDSGETQLSENATPDVQLGPTASDDGCSQKGIL